MAKAETWYDRQANISKLITYAALLILVASIGWAAYSAFEEYRQPSAAAATAPAGMVKPDAAMASDYHMAMISAIGGTSIAAFLIGLSAVIDLLIVQCEALRTRR